MRSKTRGRTREEIERDIPKRGSLAELGVIQKLNLEVMLDIRDLLQNPPQENQQESQSQEKKQEKGEEYQEKDHSNCTWAPN